MRYFLLLLLSCTSKQQSANDDGYDCPIGSEGCECTTGGSCDDDLACLSSLCVSGGEGEAEAESESESEAEAESESESEAESEAESESEAEAESESESESEGEPCDPKLSECVVKPDYLGPGYECPDPDSLGCAEGLSCEYIDDAYSYICTKVCDVDENCYEFDVGACCQIPDPDTDIQICIPAELPNLNSYSGGGGFVCGPRSQGDECYGGIECDSTGGVDCFDTIFSDIAICAKDCSLDASVCPDTFYCIAGATPSGDDVICIPPEYYGG